MRTEEYEQNTSYIDDLSEEYTEDFGTEKNRRAERRKQDIRKAKRKKRIAENAGGIRYDNLHEYSKNKIHCSCPMCSGMSKTNSKKINKGGAKPQSPRRIGFGTTNHRNGKNYKISEIRKIEQMEYDD